MPIPLIAALVVGAAGVTAAKALAENSKETKREENDQRVVSEDYVKEKLGRRYQEIENKR